MDVIKFYAKSERDINLLIHLTMSFSSEIGKGQAPLSRYKTKHIDGGGGGLQCLKATLIALQRDTST